MAQVDTITNQRKTTEAEINKLERVSLEDDTLEKFLKYVGLDPSKITKAYIFDSNSRELQFSMI
jgi:hypothetical protein